MKNKGYTLLELLGVIVIIAVILAIVFTIKMTSIINILHKFKKATFQSLSFDILFSSEKDAESDQRFADACAKYDNVVTGYIDVFTEEVTSDENGNLNVDKMAVSEKVLPYAELRETTTQGFVNAMMDEKDGIIRSSFLYFDEEDGTRGTSFSSAIMF